MTTPRIINRFNSSRLEYICAQLAAWQVAAQESLDNEESKTSPNHERVTEYTERIDALDEAIDALQRIN
jgi:ubiquinone biosynthesis protein UbiJ